MLQRFLISMFAIVVMAGFAGLVHAQGIVYSITEPTTGMDPEYQIDRSQNEIHAEGTNSSPLEESIEKLRVAYDESPFNGQDNWIFYPEQVLVDWEPHGEGMGNWTASISRGGGNNWNLSDVDMGTPIPDHGIIVGAGNPFTVLTSEGLFAVVP